jgi:hypothetical protein
MFDMPAKILPPTSTLRALVEKGLTHQQIADAISKDTGYTVSRSAVSAALHRANETTRAKRYVDELPWVVHERHQTHYAARMLRLLGRRRAGITNSEESNKRLDSWLSQLEEAGAVVAYDPKTPEGFHYTFGEPNHKGIPILRDLPE